jgi:hypothetical protein
MIVGLALGAVIQGCASGMGYQRPEEQESEELNSLLSPSFEKLWNRATIVLGSPSSTGVGSPFFLGGRRGEGPFPLIVHATLMDSMLIEGGIREFGRLACLDMSSLDAYRQSYRKHRRLDQNVFVYVEIQTSLADEYLEAGHWIFFVEDQEWNQIEPARIVQHPVQRQIPRPGSPYEVESPAAFSTAKRIIDLYFPLKRFSPVHHSLASFGTLKFVVLDINNSRVRAEGMWDLAALH